MKMLKKKIIMTVGLLTVTTVLVACGESASKNVGSKNKDGVIEVKIPSYKTGENSAAKFFLPQVDRFNEKYSGKYKLTIEETPQDSYSEKIKQLAQQNKLPVIIHGTGSGEIDAEWFNKVVIKNDMAYDLSSWLNDNKEIKERMIPESIDYNMSDNGKLVAVPKTIVQPKVVFYNETLYNPKKPIREMSMIEFLESLDENKIAYTTAENAWTSGLMLSAMIAEQEGGKELLASYGDKQLTDFTNPIIVKAVEQLKESFQKYGASNSLGAAYADAANAFMSEKAAVIPNGPWMTSDFTEESTDKWSNDFKGENVRVDLFPSNLGILTMQAHGEWISSNASDEEKELAKAYFEFVNSEEELEAYMLADGGTTPNYQPSEQFMNEIKKNSLLLDMQEAVTSKTVYAPNFLDIVPPSIADNEIAKLLPNLMTDKITAEEFCQELTDKVKK